MVCHVRNALSMRAALGLFSLLSLALPASLRGEETVLADFERGGLSETWVGIRRIRAERVEAPKSENQIRGAPMGRALKIQTGGNAGLFTRTGLPKEDWAKVESLSFWVHRGKDEAALRKRTSLELQFYEADGKTRFWRRVDLDHTGWKRFQVDLKWCRWGTGRVPGWEDVKRFGFWFRDAGEIVIDNVSITKSSKKLSRLMDTDLKAIMVPGKPKSVRAFDEGQHVRILTDADKLDGPALGKHLDQVAGRIIKDFEFLPPPTKPAYLLVFSDRESYQTFPARFALRQKSNSDRLTTAGFTFQGLATSYWTEIYGTLRPVYAHEFTHALLTQILDLSNEGEWLHEGLAVRYQLAAVPQKDFREIVRQGVMDTNARKPLSGLLNGKPIATNSYWQAMTAVDFLSTKYAKQWPGLIKAIREKGTTDLGPHLKPVLGTNWEQLEADWLAYCREKYAPKG